MYWTARWIGAGGSGAADMIVEGARIAGSSLKNEYSIRWYESGLVEVSQTEGGKFPPFAPRDSGGVQETSMPPIQRDWWLVIFKTRETSMPPIQRDWWAKKLAGLRQLGISEMSEVSFASPEDCWY